MALQSPPAKKKAKPRSLANTPRRHGGEGHTRYRWKLVGGSPELCRCPGSHGSADFGAVVTLSCSLATYYPLGHAMRAKCNADALWCCMSRTWVKCAPTSGRIAEDIIRTMPVLEKSSGPRAGWCRTGSTARASGGGASTTWVTARGGPAYGSVRPGWSPSHGTRSSRAQGHLCCLNRGVWNWYHFCDTGESRRSPQIKTPVHPPPAISAHKGSPTGPSQAPSASPSCQNFAVVGN